MKTYLILFMAVLAYVQSAAQVLKVKEMTTLRPISEVAIYGNNNGQPIFTNSQGEVPLDYFSQSDTLFLSHIGYYPRKIDKASISDKPVLLSEKGYELEEVVVSSSKFEEKRKDVAQQIQVVSSKDLAFLNQQTSADVLTQTGNVLVQKSQMGGGSPIIRGFEANKVLLVVDGVRMNNAIYRAGHLQNIITVDNSMLDKTEIAFGPASVVYGSDALGGVVHFYTKQAQLADSGKPNLVKANAFMRYSSANNEKTGHVDVNLGFKKFASLTSFTVSDFEDLKTGSNRNPFYGDWGKRPFYVERINNKDSIVKNEDVDLQKKSAYRQYDFLQKFLFQQSRTVSHGLNFQYSTSTDVPRYDRLTEVDGQGRPRSAEWYYGPQKRLFGSYTLGLRNLGKIADQGKVILAIQDIEESRHNRNFNSSNLNHRIEKVAVYSLNVDLARLIGKNEVRYGVEATHNVVNSTANRENIRTGERTPLDTRYPDGGSTMTTAAAYVTHTAELSPKLVLNDGIRYSYISLESKFNDKTFFPFPYNSAQQKNSALSGSLGLVYLPGNDWKLSALGSTGFRAPNLDDMGKVFEQSGGGRVMVPNPNLKPEYTYNAELGITKGFYKQTWVQLTGFYTWYQNAITTQNAQFEGKDSVMYNNTMSKVVMLTNANRAYLCGFSASLQTDLSPNFGLNGTFNYTYARIKTDTTDYPLDHIPPIYGKVGATWKVKQFKSEFYVLYNGWKRLSEYNLIGEDNIAYATKYGTPGWYTLNLRMSYQVNSYLQVQAAVENILDQHYRMFASGISAPRRNFVLTLRGSF